MKRLNNWIGLYHAWKFNTIIAGDYCEPRINKHSINENNGSGVRFKFWRGNWASVSPKKNMHNANNFPIYICINFMIGCARLFVCIRLSRRLSRLRSITCLRIHMQNTCESSVGKMRLYDGWCMSCAECAILTAVIVDGNKITSSKSIRNWEGISFILEKAYAV